MIEKIEYSCAVTPSVRACGNRLCEFTVYFDCAEPSARMLRASLAEDESHLHGKLSQVKFDNTSVC